MTEQTHEIGQELALYHVDNGGTLYRLDQRSSLRDIPERERRIVVALLQFALDELYKLGVERDMGLDQIQRPADTERGF